MTDTSKLFLEENLPEVLKADSVCEALDLLYALIDEKGFEPPCYDEYNNFGREAQRVYDDLYWSNPL